MKNKVINVSSMGDYYVVEELDYNNKKYILCFDINEEYKSDEEIELALFEVNIDNDDLVLNNVEDEIAKVVTSMIMDKLREE